MPREVTSDMSDREIEDVLEEIGIGNDDEISKAVRRATPRQVFMVVLPWGVRNDPDASVKLAGVLGTLQVIVHGRDGGNFLLKFADADLAVEEATAPDPDATVTLDMDTWNELSRNEITPQAAFLAAKIKIDGDLGLLMRIQGITPGA